MAVEGERSRTLGITNCFLAAVPLALLSGSWVLRYVLDSPRPLWEERSLVASVGIGSLYVCCALLGTWSAQWLVLLALTKTEAFGIRIFGRMHCARMTATVAKAITGHATAGWVAGSALASLGFAVGLVLHDRAMHHNVGAVRGAFMLAPIWIPVLGGFVGLLWFEVIVYIGVLNCRFANRSKPDVPSSPVWFDGRAQGLDIQGESGQST